MNIQQLKDSGWIIYECISGSHAYGTNVEGSDEDRRGVFIMPTFDLLGTQYFPQISDEKNDTTFYEIRTFIELLAKGNPNMLELLNTPEECIVFKHEIWDNIFTPEVKAKFITKKLKHTFSGYAYAQLKKANSLDKMMNWEQEKVTRKDVLDFCYCIIDETEDSISFKKWISITRVVGTILYKGGFKETEIGLAKVNNVPDLYSMYLLSGETGGIVSDDSNDVQLRSIPKGSPHIGYLRFNKEGYSQHCKEYRQYTEWLSKRNTARFIDTTQTSNQKNAKGFIDCYLDEDTLYLTNNGWKRYDDVTNLDKLATINSNKELNYEHYTRRHDSIYSGDIWTFESRYTKFSVTPNHNIYVSDMHRSLSNNFSTKYDDSVSNWHLESVEDYMKSRKSFKHYLISLKNSKKDIDLTREDLLVLGAYISDGTYNRGIVIDQDENKPLTPLLRSLKTVKFKETSYFRKERNKYYKRFIINDEKLNKIANDEIGHGSFVKRLPKRFFDMSEKQCEWFLDSLIAGDGTINKKSKYRVYYSSNYNLISDLQTLLFINGYNCQVYSYTHKGGFENTPSEKYHLFISKFKKSTSFLSKPPTAFKKIGKSKKIMWRRETVTNKKISCFSIPSGVLITKNSNKIAIQGNSKNTMHLIRLLNMAKDISSGKGIIVRRPEAEYLKEIRKGKHDLQSILDTADKIIEEIGESFDNSSLPYGVDPSFVNELVKKFRIWDLYGEIK